MSLLGQLFGRPPTGAQSQSQKAEQAVLVLLEETGSPEKVYKQDDLAKVADKLKAVVERKGLGQLGGNEFGPTETTLFMYGPDAEQLFAGIEPILRACPQCQGARVVIRRGGPGAEQREVKL